VRRLEGTAAVVTGSSSGIGKAIALGLASEGSAVAVNYHGNEAGARDTVSRIERAGGRAFAVRADVGDAGQVEAMFGEVRRRLGRVDVLVNNAGITPKGSFGSHSAEDWNRLVATNLSGMVFCAQACLPLMPDGGAILNISSIHAVRTTFRFSIYAATKGGVEALTRSLSLELSPRRIRVNALRLGWIQVERDRLEPGEETYQRACERIPLGLPGEVADVVPMALLLCSPDGGYVTGQVVGIDGGQEIALNAPYPTGFER
jgi:NAD(P)-dependent dehydrogenase (short-subunit alcohol dehydrogenase family)